MPTLQVNLDAMISREDLEEIVDTNEARKSIKELRLTDLEQSSPFFNSVRKPDFQRATANWSPDKVADLVKSFIDGEFIPSLIVWESNKTGKFFIIDGSHRLSALIAWVNNDYGNGVLSKKFFGDDGITEAQKKLAKRTSELINDIGTYADLKLYAQHPEKAPNEEHGTRARKIFNARMEFQTVEGDAKIAERSFFKINMSATVIDGTELAILKARGKPNAIATCALIHAGRGHKFWKFEKTKQQEIETLAFEIHEVLFKPILDDPIKTMDLPIAGHSYTAHTFQMLLDLVNMLNDVTPAMWMEPKKIKKNACASNQIEDDIDGSATIEYLKKVRSAAYLITGAQSGSLGLHPAIYFYGDNGRFYPAALLAAMKFFLRLEREHKLLDFTKYRYDFEEFLIHHRQFIKQLGHIKGGSMRPVDSIVGMYEIIYKEVKSGSDESGIIDKLKKDERLKALDETEKPELVRRRNFSKDDKSTAFLRDAINSPIRCKYCNARLHLRSMSADHMQRMQDGGLGGADNLQFMHFFCNNGAKESDRSKV